MLTIKDFKIKLEELLDAADKEGKLFVDITSVDLHKLVGGYPAKDGNHRMPICCDSMYAIMKGKDKLIHASPSGDSSTLTIRYYFPR